MVLLLAIGFAVMVALTLVDFRREVLTSRLFSVYKTMVPSISNTEREALEAGTVSWDGELFTGQPDWTKLMAVAPPRLTDAEQAFLDGPVETACAMVNDWEVCNKLGDLPPEVLGLPQTRKVLRDDYSDRIRRSGIFCDC